MIALARILGVARFVLAANLRNGLTRGGVVLGAILMLSGPAIAVTRDLAWSFDPQFGFFGFLILALFGLRSGLQEQRELGLSTFFRRNFLRPTEHALALVLALLGSWAAVCALGFAAILLIGGGNAGTAAWYASSWGLRALLLVGFVPLVERVASFRLPLVVPTLGYMALLVALTVLLPEDEALALFVPAEPGDMEALRRLAVQALTVLAVTSGVFVLGTASESWVRSGLDRIRRLVPP